MYVNLSLDALVKLATMPNASQEYINMLGDYLEYKHYTLNKDETTNDEYYVIGDYAVYLVYIPIEEDGYITQEHVGYRICKSLSSQVRYKLYNIFGVESMIYIDSIMDSYEKSHNAEYTNDEEVVNHAVQDLLSLIACWSMHYLDAYNCNN